MDWWGHPCAVDTSEIDELRYRLMREMLARSEGEVVMRDEADPGSIINGGSGWPTLRGDVRW